MKKIFIILILLLSTYCIAQDRMLEKVEKYITQRYDNRYDELLYVNILEQKMYLIKQNEIVNTFIISSSENGTGSKSGSNKTPIGLHKIKEKIGHETPIYGRMIGRKFYGEIAKIYYDKTRSKTDDITSRILWLEGIEDGLNKGFSIDSYKRYIYIHGTSEEGLLGIPSSHGCIRMGNKEVIELYDIIKIGTLVLIL